MDKNNNVTVLDSYLPGNLVNKVLVKKAYVAKAGFVRLSFKGDYQKIFFDGFKSRTLPFDELLDELYKVLSSSPHVMEISPAKMVVMLIVYVVFATLFYWLVFRATGIPVNKSA